MAGVNKAIIVGNLGRDREIRYIHQRRQLRPPAQRGDDPRLHQQCLVAVTTRGNTEFVSWKEHLGIGSMVPKLGVAGVVPDVFPATEPRLVRELKQALAPAHHMLLRHPRFPVVRQIGAWNGGFTVRTDRSAARARTRSIAQPRGRSEHDFGHGHALSFGAPPAEAELPPPGSVEPVGLADTRSSPSSKKDHALRHGFRRRRESHGMRTHRPASSMLVAGQVLDEGYAPPEPSAKGPSRRDGDVLAE